MSVVREQEDFRDVEIHVGFKGFALAGDGCKFHTQFHWPLRDTNTEALSLRAEVINEGIQERAKKLEIMAHSNLKSRVQKFVSWHPRATTTMVIQPYSQYPFGTRNIASARSLDGFPYRESQGLESGFGTVLQGNYS
jgi:hypothetical protein